jgi:hypothetical protein
MSLGQLFEEVGPIRREIRVLYEFNKIAFRVSYEDRRDALANLNWLTANQVNVQIFQPGCDLLDVADDECDISYALAPKNPLWNPAWLERDILRLNQLNSFSIGGLQTNDPEAVWPGSKFCAHLCRRFGIRHKLKPQDIGIKSEHAIEIGAYYPRFQWRYHPQGPGLIIVVAHMQLGLVRLRFRRN